MSIFHDSYLTSKWAIRFHDSYRTKLGTSLVIFWVHDSMDWWNMMEPIAKDQTCWDYFRIGWNHLEITQQWCWWHLESPPCDDQQSLWSEFFFSCFRIPYPLCIPYLSILYPLFIPYLSPIISIINGHYLNRFNDPPSSKRSRGKTWWRDSWNARRWVDLMPLALLAHDFVQQVGAGRRRLIHIHIEKYWCTQEVYVLWCYSYMDV